MDGAGSLKKSLRRRENRRGRPESTVSPDARQTTGVLTGSMSRLRDEILALRSGRQSLHNSLVASIAAIRSRVATLRHEVASDLNETRGAWHRLGRAQR